MSKKFKIIDLNQRINHIIVEFYDDKIKDENGNIKSIKTNISLDNARIDLNEGTLKQYILLHFPSNIIYAPKLNHDYDYISSILNTEIEDIKSEELMKSENVNKVSDAINKILESNSSSTKK